MAKKRCISIEIVDDDRFTEMPSSAQNLYFHINVRSDDDGFCNCPMKIVRTIGASTDDLRLLFAKKFLLECPNGVVLVKHWWIHNLKRKDRYKPSNFLKDVELYLDENDSYTFTPTEKRYFVEWQPNGNQMAPQDKISKDKLNKSNIIPSVSKELDSRDINSHINSLKDIEVSNDDTDLPF